MKLNKLSFLAGAIALTLTAIPFAAQANLNSSSPVIVAQGKKQGPLSRLDLTDDQKTQIQEIKKSARAQMKKILTPQQLQTLREAKASGQNKRQALRSLDLNESQKAELKKIRQSKRSEIEAILTDEQKQELREMRQKFQNRRGNRPQQPLS